MLVFDHFRLLEDAFEFATEVARLGVNFIVMTDAVEAQKIAFFPQMLIPPVVLAERSPETVELSIRRIVERYNGRFRGT